MNLQVPLKALVQKERVNLQYLQRTEAKVGKTEGILLK